MADTKAKVVPETPVFDEAAEAVKAGKAKSLYDKIKNFDVDSIKTIDDVKVALKAIQKHITGDF